MPLYEYYGNAENKVALSEELKSGIVVGTDRVIREIARVAREKGAVAIDGWYGVNFAALQTALQKELGGGALFLHSAELYRDAEDIAKYQAKYVTEDPSFGWVNSEGVLQDLMEPARVAQALEKLRKAAAEGRTAVVYGPGAAV